MQPASFPVARGEGLLEVLATQHIGLDGVVTPIAYSMRFDSSGWMRVSANNNTLRVEMIDGPEDGYDMGKYGQVQQRPMTEEPPFRIIVGKHLTAVDRISTSVSSSLGYRFTFGEEPILIFAWGDELMTSRQVPDFLAEVDPHLEPAG